MSGFQQRFAESVSRNYTWHALPMHQGGSAPFDAAVETSLGVAIVQTVDYRRLQDSQTFHTTRPDNMDTATLDEHVHDNSEPCTSFGKY